MMQVEECVHAVHAWAYEEFSFLPQPTRPKPPSSSTSLCFKKEIKEMNSCHICLETFPWAMLQTTDPLVSCTFNTEDSSQSPD